MRSDGPGAGESAAQDSAARAAEVLRPRDEADVAQILAQTAGPLEIIGGGSKRAIGRPVDAAVLDLSALQGILDYQPHELVLTALAATPLQQIEEVLSQQRQRLAFEPPDLGALLGLGAPTAAPGAAAAVTASAATAAAGVATLGGVLASNLSGPRRLSAGAARDHFLGFRAVGSTGERFRGGGRVVKNVTGFDLPKLLAGSWGTLAVLTEVTVRVVPASETEVTVLLPVKDAATAARISARALGSMFEVSAAALQPGQGLGLRLEGFGPSVESRTRGLLAHLGSPDHQLLQPEASRQFWRSIGEVRHLAGFPIVWRLALPPQAAARVLDEIRPADFLLDWGGGRLWLGMPEAGAEAGAEAEAQPLRVRAALSTGGHAMLIKAPEALRRVCAVFPPQPAPIAALNAGLKAAFDPAHRLNPGRMD